MGSHKKAKKNRVLVESKASKLGYCLYDKLPCKRFDYEFDKPVCWVYDIHGYLKWVCPRFVAPVGFSIPKRLSI